MGLIESILTLSGKNRVTYDMLARDIVVPSKDVAERNLKLVTLQRVNAIRGEFMLPPLDELPQGRRGVAGGCPIANGIKLWSGDLFEAVSVGSEGQVTVTMKENQHTRAWGGTLESEHFVHAFDQGDGFTELDAAPVR